MSPDPVSEYLSRLGRKGAQSANQKRTAAQRSKIAKKAAEARWKRIDRSLARTKRNIE